MTSVKACFQDLSEESSLFKYGKTSDNLVAYKEYSPRRGPAASIPILMLHGLMRAKETWDECGPSIADRTNSKVYSLDARNHGDSQWVETMDYNSMADDVIQFMDDMKIPNATILGHGMGGKAGMVLALKYPQRIQSLILEDTSLNSHSKDRKALRWSRKIYEEVLDYVDSDLGLKAAKRSAVSGMVVRHYYYIIKKRKNKPKIWDGSDLPLKPKAGGGFEWNLHLKAITENMPCEPWKHTGVFEGPVLTIYGTRSVSKVLEQKDEFLKQFPRSLFEPIPEGVSYPLHIEYPDMFIDLVCDFILKQQK